MAHSVTISWTASVDSVDGYNVYRGPSAGGELASALNPTLITGTSFIDTAPPVGESFYFVKSVANGNELSVPSNEVSVVILPAPPTNLAVTASS